jgi:hypothetical protein
MAKKAGEEVKSLVPDDFMAELNKASGVEAPVPDADTKPEPKDEKPAPDAKPDADEDVPDATEEKPEGGEVTPVSDELFERAIRAGMTRKDADAVKDPEALERIVGNLERSKTAEKPKEGDASKGQGEDGDLASKVPDLDPVEYDEKVVSTFKAMKDALISMQKTISELRKNGSPEASMIDKKIADLGREWSDVFGKDGKGKADLEEAIKFVTKLNPGLAPDKIFDRALRAAFSDKVSTLEKAKLSAAAAKRAERAIDRPRNINGKFAPGEAGAPKMTDAEAEASAIAEINAMAAGR